MKNITVSIDDEIYRKARIKAAELGVSVSSVFRKFLQTFTSSPDSFDELLEREMELWKIPTKFSVAESLPRDELYKREP